jgi:hypothetical protein
MIMKVLNMRTFIAIEFDEWIKEYLWELPHTQFGGHDKLVIY